MKSLTNNLINGNLTDAKQAAQIYTYYQIWNYLCNTAGWSATKAKAAAVYLKNPSQETYDMYCNWETVFR